VPTCTLVIGFHRSGTSALTGALIKLGLDPGDFSDERSPENPTGFHEHPAVKAINKRLFQAAGSSWCDWTAFVDEPLDMSTLRDEFSEAVEFVRSQFQSSSTFIIKDPRMMVWLSFWEQAIEEAGNATDVVFIIRDPDECARSQVKRAAANPLLYGPLSTYESMHALWCRYHFAFAKALRTRPILVQYGDLTGRPEETLREVARSLGRKPDPFQLEQAASHIDPSLNRSQPGNDTESRISAWNRLSKSFYRAFCDLDGQITSENLQKLPVLAELETVQELLRPAQTAINAYERLHDTWSTRGIVSRGLLRNAVESIESQHQASFLHQIRTLVAGSDYEADLYATFAIAFENCGETSWALHYLDQILTKQVTPEWVPKRKTKLLEQLANTGMSDEG
jgi:hypothetical protein